MKLLKNLMIVLIAALAGAGIFEVFVRLTGGNLPPTPSQLEAASVRYEPAVYARHLLIENQDLDSYCLGHEAYYHINSRGYRGAEFDAVKPVDRTRLIFYGGSSTFDIWNSDPYDWPHLVQHILNESGSSRFEVINAGIPGQDSSEAVTRFMTEGYRFKPDYAVIYSAWNDLKTLKFTNSLLRTQRPMQPSKNPYLSYHGRLDELLSEHSKTYNLIRDSVIGYLYPLAGEGALRREPSAQPLREENFEQYRLNLLTFVNLAREVGATPIIMGEAHLVVAHNTPDQLKHIHTELVDLSPEGTAAAYDRLNGIAAQVAREKSVLFVDTNDMNGVSGYFVDHVHTLPAGSQKLAETFVTAFRSHFANPAS